MSLTRKSLMWMLAGTALVAAYAIVPLVLGYGATDFEATLVQRLPAWRTRYAIGWVRPVATASQGCCTRLGRRACAKWLTEVRAVCLSAAKRVNRGRAAQKTHSA